MSDNFEHHLGGTQPTRQMVAEDLTPEQIEQLAPLVNSDDEANQNLALEIIKRMGLDGNEVYRAAFRCLRSSLNDDYGMWTFLGYKFYRKIYGTVGEWSLLEINGHIEISLKHLYRPTPLQIYDAAREQIKKSLML